MAALSRLRKLNRTTGLALISAGVTLWAGVSAGWPGPRLRVWERSIEQQLLLLRGPRRPPRQVVMVPVDDASLQQAAWFTEGGPNDVVPAWARGLNTLPWPRAAYGQLSQRLMQAGVAAVFAPERAAMYPAGFQTHVEVEQLTLGLCGASRRGHFRGVTTVVCKLLNLAMADVAVFGEKDWQQLAAIRRMALDLDHPTRILGGAVVREPDGLAMSSRNVYLDADARQRAAGICASLRAAQAAVRAGDRDAGAVRSMIVAAIEAAGGRVDYVELVDPDLLTPVADLGQPTRAIVAAWFGGARLLDNLALN